MTDRWLCEADSTDSDKDHKEDAAYLTHLADDANAPPLIELAETICQEDTDYMTELSSRLELGNAPVVIASF